MKLYTEAGLLTDNVTHSHLHDFQDPNYGTREPVRHEQHDNAQAIRSAHQRKGFDDKSFTERWPSVHGHKY